MAVGISGVEAFIREFFDQNPLSHLGLILLRDGVATRVTELGGNPESHIRRLRENRTCSGDASIQVGGVGGMGWEGWGWGGWPHTHCLQKCVKRNE